MKTIACYNIKGGVGKTATAVNLAYLAAQEGRNTLLWDLDPQGAASFYFRIKPKIKGGGWALLKQKQALMDAIKATDYPCLDLIPADFSYRHLDFGLDRQKNPGHHLAKLIKPLGKEYDCLILDCPPGLSLLSENVFFITDILLVPTIPTILSLRTLDQLTEFCKKSGHNQFTLLSFFSMVDRRKGQHRKVLERKGFLRSHIPYANGVEQMGNHRAPLECFDRTCLAAEEYRKLWLEVQATVHSLGK